MRVVISWSGEESLFIGQRLKVWLKYVIQSLELWISDEDIAAGARWARELDTQLEHANFGIICLTRENLSRPWLMFESGALSKSLTSARVVPVLYGLSKAELSTGPLVQFQAVEATQEGIRSLVLSLHKAEENPAVSRDMVERVFEAWWPQLDSDLRSRPPTLSANRSAPSDRQILEEILDLTRKLSDASRISESSILSYLEEKWENWSREEYRVDSVPLDKYEGAERASIEDALDYIRTKLDKYSQAIAAIKQVS
jgi:hypothetical protein